MAYRALKSFPADGVNYNPGDIVPAHEWKTKRALLSARWIKEVPDTEDEGPGEPALVPPENDGGTNEDDIQEAPPTPEQPKVESKTNEAAATLNGMTVAKLELAVLEITDKDIIKTALEKEIRKTAIEALENRYAELSAKGE